MLTSSSSATFLSVLSLALATTASPVVTIRDSPIKLAFARQINKEGILNVVKNDQARAESLRLNADRAASAGGSLEQAAVISTPATNAGVSYIASVGVGSPATQYNLIIDTGSSNTWVGAGKAYVKTGTSKTTTDTVAVNYGSGSFSGNEYVDQVTIGNGLVIPAQSIGVATTSSGFSGVDGILGIGPAGLTYGTLKPSTKSTIATVIDQLYSRKTISFNEISVSFQPSSTQPNTNGELTFGGVDSTKYTGSLRFIPRTKTYPAAAYWGIDQSIRYGPSTTILSTTAGIVDTGTTLVLIAADAFAKYKTATGAVMDNASGLLRLTPSQYSNLKSLYFTAGGTTYELTANAQIWPRALNTYIGGTNQYVYLIVGSLSKNSGSGLDFINGQTFLERFYSVYRSTDGAVGFATTSYTAATTN